MQLAGRVEKLSSLDLDPIPLRVRCSGLEVGGHCKRGIADPVVRRAYAFAARAKVQVAAGGSLTGWDKRADYSLPDPIGSIA